MFIVPPRKSRHLLRVSSFTIGFFAHSRRNLSSSSTFRMTGVEDTHLALAVIPFDVGANNSLIFCYYKHMYLFLSLNQVFHNNKQNF